MKLNLEVHEAKDGHEGLRLLEGGEYSLLLSDYMLPGIDGLELISRARDMKPDLPIILVTGYATVERAVKAMNLGADHVLEKPLDLPVLCEIAKTVMARRGQLDLPEKLREEVEQRLGTRFISNYKGKMRELAQTLERVAQTDCTILLYGESGTGKELVARAIHERSPRKKGPFVPVNCGAIPESLLESELFGHTRGAFTGAVRDRPGRFALADEGTIFLDEIGEMSPIFQVKLLRVLQEHSFEPVGSRKAVSSDFRVLAATHRELVDMVQEGTFREDLFYRLNVMEINLPPLRERVDDLTLLVRQFIENSNKRHRLKIDFCEPAFLKAMQQYPWPGNVRELENMIERLCILKGEGKLSRADLPPKILGHSDQITSSGTGLLPEDGTDFYKVVEQFENSLISQALERTNGNKNRAANMLSLNRTTLVEKMKKRGLL
jgi:DNA-binding NtrC family response regulator